MSGRIALGAGTACLLVLGAVVLWVATVLASAGSVCAGPDAAGTGFETLSDWPPGQRCISGGTSTVTSAIPWATPVIVLMLCGAGATLLLAIGAQMHLLRSRVATAQALREPAPEAPVPLEALAAPEGTVEPAPPSEVAIRVLRDAA